MTNQFAQKNIFRTLILFAMLCLVLTSCNMPTDQPDETIQLSETAVEIQQETAQEPTSIPQEPTSEPAPVQQNKVILIESPLVSGLKLDVLRNVLQELAAGSGLVLESRPTLQPGEISADWKIIILPGYADTLSEALTAAPQVQFLVISEFDLGMAGNLSVIRWRPENQAFMAGYLSTLLASDYRAAGLVSEVSPNVNTLEQAYMNGGQFYCGICASIYSPITRFPLTARMQSSTDQAYWQYFYDELQNSIVYLMYVDPDIANPDFLRYLAQNGMTLIGGDTPPDEIRSRWAATVRQDIETPLREIWSQLHAGTGGQVLEVDVLLEDINEDYVTQGKQRIIEVVLQDLKDGLIAPLDVPMQ